MSVRMSKRDAERLAKFKAKKKVDPTPRPAKVKSGSYLEAIFADQVSIAGLPCPTREHRFHPVRRWLFDFAWPVFRLALEIEGGLYHKGRHTTLSGFTKDCEKYNVATLMGWRVLRVTGAQVKSGEALNWIQEGLRK